MDNGSHRKIGTGLAVDGLPPASSQLEDSGRVSTRNCPPAASSQTQVSEGIKNWNFSTAASSEREDSGRAKTEKGPAAASGQPEDSGRTKTKKGHAAASGQSEVNREMKTGKDFVVRANQTGDSGAKNLNYVDDDVESKNSASREISVINSFRANTDVTMKKGLGGSSLERKDVSSKSIAIEVPRVFGKSDRMEHKTSGFKYDCEVRVGHTISPSSFYAKDSCRMHVNLNSEQANSPKSLVGSAVAGSLPEIGKNVSNVCVQRLSIMDTNRVKNAGRFCKKAIVSEGHFVSNDSSDGTSSAEDVEEPISFHCSSDSKNQERLQRFTSLANANLRTGGFSEVSEEDAISASDANGNSHIDGSFSCDIECGKSELTNSAKATEVGRSLDGVTYHATNIEPIGAGRRQDALRSTDEFDDARSCTRQIADNEVDCQRRFWSPNAILNHTSSEGDTWLGLGNAAMTTSVLVANADVMQDGNELSGIQRGKYENRKRRHLTKGPRIICCSNAAKAVDSVNRRSDTENDWDVEKRSPGKNSSVKCKRKPSKDHGKETEKVRQIVMSLSNAIECSANPRADKIKQKHENIEVIAFPVHFENSLGTKINSTMPGKIYDRSGSLNTGGVLEEKRTQEGSDQSYNTKGTSSERVQGICRFDDAAMVQNDAERMPVYKDDVLFIASDALFADGGKCSRGLDQHCQKSNTNGCAVGVEAGDGIVNLQGPANAALPDAGNSINQASRSAVGIMKRDRSQRKKYCMEFGKVASSNDERFGSKQKMAQEFHDKLVDIPALVEEKDISLGRMLTFKLNQDPEPQPEPKPEPQPQPQWSIAKLSGSMQKSKCGIDCKPAELNWMCAFNEELTGRARLNWLATQLNGIKFSALKQRKVKPHCDALKQMITTSSAFESSDTKREIGDAITGENLLHNLKTNLVRSLALMRPIDVVDRGNSRKHTEKELRSAVRKSDESFLTRTQSDLRKPYWRCIATKRNLAARKDDKTRRAANGEPTTRDDRSRDTDVEKCDQEESRTRDLEVAESGANQSVANELDTALSEMGISATKEAWTEDAVKGKSVNEVFGTSESKMAESGPIDLWVGDSNQMECEEQSHLHDSEIDSDRKSEAGCSPSRDRILVTNDSVEDATDDADLGPADIATQIECYDAESGSSNELVALRSTAFSGDLNAVPRGKDSHSLTRPTDPFPLECTSTKGSRNISSSSPPVEKKSVNLAEEGISFNGNEAEAFFITDTDEATVQSDGSEARKKAERCLVKQENVFEEHHNEKNTTSSIQMDDKGFNTFPNSCESEDAVTSEKCAEIGSARNAPIDDRLLVSENQSSSHVSSGSAVKSHLNGDHAVGWSHDARTMPGVKRERGEPNYSVDGEGEPTTGPQQSPSGSSLVRKKCFESNLNGTDLIEGILGRTSEQKLSPSQNSITTASKACDATGREGWQFEDSTGKQCRESLLSRKRKFEEAEGQKLKSVDLAETIAKELFVVEKKPLLRSIFSKAILDGQNENSSGCGVYDAGRMNIRKGELQKSKATGYSELAGKSERTEVKLDSSARGSFFNRIGESKSLSLPTEYPAFSWKAFNKNISDLFDAVGGGNFKVKAEVVSYEGVDTNDVSKRKPFHDEGGSRGISGSFPGISGKCSVGVEKTGESVPMPAKEPTKTAVSNPDEDSHKRSYSAFSACTRGGVPVGEPNSEQSSPGVDAFMFNLMETIGKCGNEHVNGVDTHVKHQSDVENYGDDINSHLDRDIHLALIGSGRASSCDENGQTKIESNKRDVSQGSVSNPEEWRLSDSPKDEIGYGGNIYCKAAMASIVEKCLHLGDGPLSVTNSTNIRHCFARKPRTRKPSKAPSGQQTSTCDMTQIPFPVSTLLWKNIRYDRKLVGRKRELPEPEPRMFSWECQHMFHGRKLWHDRATINDKIEKHNVRMQRIIGRHEKAVLRTSLRSSTKKSEQVNRSVSLNDEKTEPKGSRATASKKPVLTLPRDAAFSTIDSSKSLRPNCIVPSNREIAADKSSGHFETYAERSNGCNCPAIVKCIKCKVFKSPIRKLAKTIAKHARKRKISNVDKNFCVKCNRFLDSEKELTRHFLYHLVDKAVNDNFLDDSDRCKEKRRKSRKPVVDKSVKKSPLKDGDTSEMGVCQDMETAEDSISTQYPTYRAQFWKKRQIPCVAGSDESEGEVPKTEGSNPSQCKTVWTPIYFDVPVRPMQWQCLNCRKEFKNIRDLHLHSNACKRKHGKRE